VLLEHGRNITDLTVNAFDLTAGRVDRDCSWQTLHLKLTSQLIAPSILQFATLPLKRVQTITICAHDTYDEDTHDDHIWDVKYEDGEEQNLQHLKVPLNTSSQMPSAQLFTALHQAATNLAGCPAWQKQPTNTITILCPINKRKQLLCTLKPLGGPHIKELIIHPGDLRVHLRPATVQALADSLGNAVTSVKLSNTTCHSAFWRTFATCFPAIDSLHLGVGVWEVNQWQLTLWSYAMHRLLTVSYHISNPPLCKCECWESGGSCSCMSEMSFVLEKFGVHGVEFKHVHPSRNKLDSDDRT
jgi:hypothetical protein